MAPEVLECKPYDKACDLWSVGVITYVLLTGCFPFWDKNNAVLYEKIRRVEYGWPSGLEISAEAKDLIKHLIERQPEKRFLLTLLPTHTNNLPSDLLQSKRYDIHGCPAKAFPAQSDFLRLLTLLHADPANNQPNFCNNPTNRRQ